MAGCEASSASVVFFATAASGLDLQEATRNGGSARAADVLVTV